MPNIFILNNRWDCSAQEPEMMEEVKDLIISFFCPLQLYPYPLYKHVKYSRYKIYIVTIKSLRIERADQHCSLATFCSFTCS